MNIQNRFLVRLTGASYLLFLFGMNKYKQIYTAAKANSFDCKRNDFTA